MVLATPASPQSEPLLSSLVKPGEPPAPVEAQSEPLTPPTPRPRARPIQQPPKLPAATLSKPLTPASAQMHEQAIRQPQRIATRPAMANVDFAPDARYLPRQRIQLVDPPLVHPHEQATNQGPKIMEVRLVVEEKDMVIDEAGTKLKAMTFNGTIPAPAIVVHEGDYVEVTLVNPATNSMPHNIDFHAATGGLGGGDLTLISPGEQTVLRWKATRPGVFVYHCIPGGSMIPWHIMTGMSGVVMVLPRDGLKDGDGRSLHYDRAYYIGEQDFYVPRDKNGKFKTYATHADAFADTMELMHGLVPTHVVFEGRVGALTGKNAMPAKVGENVLIIHSQADRDSRVHLIGGHGDYLWELGKFNNPPQVDAETWLVRGGSATAAFYKFLQPGVYSYVNHNMTEAVELGATAHFKVEGTWNNDLMAQVQAPGPMRSAGKELGNQYDFSITSKESIREYASFR
jgi:nitrite reductase (NO-forming)